MFEKLTVRELNKLWKTMESAIYHMADYWGVARPEGMWTDHQMIFWDISVEIDSRE